MANLLPPIKLETTSNIEQNTITFEPGPPNEYFDGDLSNWVIEDSGGSESTSIVNNKFHIDLSAQNEFVRANYNYLVPDGDWEIIIDILNYLPDDINNGCQYDLRIRSLGTNSEELLAINSIAQGTGNYQINGLWKIDGSGSNFGSSFHANYPIKFKLIKSGSIIECWYYIFGWSKKGEKDFGSQIDNLKEISLYLTSSSPNYGGSIEIDNITITTENSYFPNDTFNNLNNWYNYNVQGSGITTNPSGKIRNTIPDGITEDIFNAFRYCIPQGDFSLEVDLASYSPNDNSNGLKAYFYTHGWPHTTDNLVNILYYVSNSGTTHNISSNLKVNGNNNIVATTIAGQPSKFKIDRVGTIITTYYYISSWVQIHTRDFTTYAPIINMPYFVTADNNQHGGYVEWDNLTLDIGIDSYNLYWKKDKCPNCYFTSLDDWVLTESDHGTISINNGKIKFDLDSGYDEVIYALYNYSLSDEDFVIIVDIPTYIPDDVANGIYLYFTCASTDDNDSANIRYHSTTSGGATKVVRSRLKVNGVLESDITDDTLTHTPTKMRVTRSGTTFENSVYVNSSWNVINSYDFSTRAGNVTDITLRLLRGSLYDGGSVEFDNLIITPSVKDSGTKIIGVTSPYQHMDLTENDIYCYEITAENIDSESDASLEEYGIPTANIPAAPVIAGINGDSQNTITIPDIYNATIYNIYWSLIPGVTVDNGTKIADVTSPYEHIDLIRQNYYYIATAENAEYESVISNELCLKPDFDSKIFNHNDIIKSRLLYQYKIKE